MADGANHMTARAPLDFRNELPFVVFKVIEPDLNEFVVFQFLAYGADEHIGHALLTNDNEWVNVVPQFAKIFTLGTGKLDHNGFRRAHAQGKRWQIS